MNSHNSTPKKWVYPNRCSSSADESADITRSVPLIQRVLQTDQGVSLRDFVCFVPFRGSFLLQGAKSRSTKYTNQHEATNEIEVCPTKLVIRRTKQPNLKSAIFNLKYSCFTPGHVIQLCKTDTPHYNTLPYEFGNFSSSGSPLVRANLSRGH